MAWGRASRIFTRFKGVLLLPAAVTIAVALSMGSPSDGRILFAQSVSCDHAVVRAPFTGETLRDVVTIFGSADTDSFIFYKLEWAPADNPEVWIAVSNIIEQPVRNGVLDRWDTSAVPDGVYRLKLTVVDDRYQEVCRFTAERVAVQNAGADESAAGQGTASPAATEARETPLPTAVGAVGARSAVTATAPPTALSEPVAEATAEASVEPPTDTPTDIPTEPPTTTPTDLPTDLPTDPPLPTAPEAQPSEAEPTEVAAAEVEAQSTAGNSADDEGQELVETDEAIPPSDGERIEEAARALGLEAAFRAFGVGFALVLAVAALVWRMMSFRRSTRTR